MSRLTCKLCNPFDDWLETTSPTNHPVDYIICGLDRELKISWIRPYVLLYDMIWSQTVFEYLFVEENCILLVCAAKDPLLKLQDADHTSETPTNQIPHVLNRQHILQISKPRKNLHVLDRRKFYMRLYNMWACTILLGIPWRKRMTSGGSTPRRYQLVLRLPLIRTKLDHLWYEISPQSLTLGVRPLCLLITHSGIQRWPA